MSSSELLEEVRQLRKLVELIAEPAIAKRDEKLRAELRRLVGVSPKRRRAVQLMDGTRTQTQISKESQFHLGELGTTVKKLAAVGLLKDKKLPQLLISIPADFFDRDP